MAPEQRRRLRKELSTTARAFRAALVDAMSTLGVHAGQNFLIDELHAEQPLATGELAKRLGIEVPTAVRMVQRMEAAGLVHRKSDPADGRRVLISLSERGNEVAAALPSRLDAVSDRAFGDLTAAERDTLISLLGRVRDNLNAPAEDGVASPRVTIAEQAAQDHAP